MVFGIKRGVERHELIRHDASSAIDDAMLKKRLVLQGIREMHAVGIRQFTTLQAVEHIHRIILVAALRVRLLDTTARRGIIMGDRESDHRAVGKVYRTLDKALAKRSATHHDATILILDSTCDNLGSRGRIAVNQNNDLTRLEHTIAIGRIFRTRHSPTLCIDDEIAFLQELLGNVDSSLQIASSVLLQVENQVVHPLLAQLIKALEELLMGCGTKVTDTDIADTWTDHIGGIDGLHGNLVAHNGKLQQILDALTDDAQTHLRALRATEALHDLLLRHLHTSDGRIIDQHNTVACQDAYLLRRTIRNGLNHEQGVLDHIELHTDALEIAIQGLAEIFHLLWGEITGMGIELVEHATDGILHQFPFIDTIHIEITDGNLGILQFAHRGIIAIANTKLGRGREGRQHQEGCKPQYSKIIHTYLLQGGLLRPPSYQ